jgi:hypothetical protein
MSELLDAVETDRALKSKHRAMWALGDYPAVATQIIPDLGLILVEACGCDPANECWTSRPDRATRPFPRH